MTNENNTHYSIEEYDNIINRIVNIKQLKEKQSLTQNYKKINVFEYLYRIIIK